MVAGDTAGLYKNPISSARHRLKHLIGKDDVHTVEGCSLRGNHPQVTGLGKAGHILPQADDGMGTLRGLPRTAKGRGRGSGGLDQVPSSHCGVGEQPKHGQGVSRSPAARSAPALCLLLINQTPCKASAPPRLYRMSPTTPAADRVPGAPQGISSPATSTLGTALKTLKLTTK